MEHRPRYVQPILPPSSIGTPSRRVDFVEKNPELIPPGNGMEFLSDDGGLTYNRCHCKLTPVVFPVNTPHDTPLPQSGATLRLAISTSGAARRTASSSRTSTPRVGSTMSGGATRPCTPSAPRCSRPRTSCTSSAISATATSPSSGVRRATSTSAESAGATPQTTLVRCRLSLFHVRQQQSS